ncbi:MAG: SUMF1/EgtB/PvdO family nonheme iron enzyme [Muribaculaceae bacterium]|nr:SUMF1/EgtB/PvdO family nonheme iron enzyme [Muribaculaceae bacterium]
MQESGDDQLVYQEESVTMMVKGDLDNDSVVDINDVNAMVNLILGRTTLYRDRADITSDGKIGIADLNALVNFMLGRTPEIRTYTINGVSFNMVTIEGGTFTMGATDEQGSDAYNDEKPAHQVTLSTFSIGETEVTQELWQAVMGSNPSHYNGYREEYHGGTEYHIDYGSNLQRPVECVSWKLCQTFIGKLNELTGESFRLPTEAEWEYAARGGNQSKGFKYAGSNDIDEVCWYSDNNPSYGGRNHGTQAVATKSPNELGLYDMSGNVMEFCSDWYGSYSGASQTNPTGPTSGSNQVLRGGEYSSSARFCRVSYRRKKSNQSSYAYEGLRLAHS